MSHSMLDPVRCHNLCAKLKHFFIFRNQVGFPAYFLNLICLRTDSTWQDGLWSAVCASCPIHHYCYRYYYCYQYSIGHISIQDLNDIQAVRYASHCRQYIVVYSGTMRRRIAHVLYHLWGVALKLQKPLEMAANPLSPVTAQNRRRIYIMYLTQCTKCLLRSATWGKLCANPVSCRYSPRVE